MSLSSWTIGFAIATGIVFLVVMISASIKTYFLVPGAPLLVVMVIITFVLLLTTHGAAVSGKYNVPDGTYNAKILRVDSWDGSAMFDLEGKNYTGSVYLADLGLAKPGDTLKMSIEDKQCQEVKVVYRVTPNSKTCGSAPR